MKKEPGYHHKNMNADVYMKLFLNSLFYFIGLCFCYCCSVTQSCPTFCDPMDWSMPECSVLHHHLELFQTHVIRPSGPLLSPYPPDFNLSQNQGLFQWVGSSHQVALVLEIQHQSFQFEYSGLITFRINWFDFLVVQWTV